MAIVLPIEKSIIHFFFKRKSRLSLTAKRMAIFARSAQKSRFLCREGHSPFFLQKERSGVEGAEPLPRV
jgi:hypothetical protein